MSFITLIKPIFLLKQSFKGLGDPWRVTRKNSFDFIGNKVGHYIQKDFSEGFDSPVDIRIKTEMIIPRKIVHTPLNCCHVGPVIMPDFPVNWWWRGDP